MAFFAREHLMRFMRFYPYKPIFEKAPDRFCGFFIYLVFAPPLLKVFG